MKRPITYILTFITIWVLGAAIPMASQAQTVLDGWHAEYYANQWLSGQPALVRTDGGIEFNWGTGAPAPGLPADHFSVRWTRDLTFANATYRFSARSDDGIRVYVDGALIIDQFTDHGPTTYSATRQMTAGTHHVVIEYYEDTGGAVAQFWWNNVAVAGTFWRGEYYNNRWLEGSPTLVRSDPQIDFNWGTASPDPLLPADGFSVRWTQSIDFTAGTYRFRTATDDGVRLFIDGSLVIDHWVNQALTTYSVDRTLSEGNHVVRMEYYENTGNAAAQLSWELVNAPAPGAGWRGEYYNNMQLAGSPVLVRTDAEIAFDWGDGSPDYRIPADHFSVRWTGSISTKNAVYVFETTTDDGVRLYVDGRLVIDEWQDMSQQTFKARVTLSQGTHDVRMEYYENVGTAMAKMRWYEADSITPAGNLITCVGAQNSWIKVYQRTANGDWLDMNPNGWGAIDVTGYLKIDGLPVDVGRYGRAGQPYKVELWSQGRLVRSVGNTDIGQPEFLIRPEADNYTPWSCPAL